ncbi:MAG: hypothetical protein ACYTBS_08805, partial [Planctomycetota bacterium]
AVKRDALKELIDELEKPETIRSADAKPNVWRIIMKSRTIKLAAAAVILIAALLAIYNVGPSGVALADVLLKVEEAKAYRYKVNMKVTGSTMQKISPWGQEMTG